MSGVEETRLAIDLKYYRMRIYRAMLQRLGCPKYIQFRVNPLKKAIVIQTAESLKAPDQTCRIDWNWLEKKSYTEITCKRFLQTVVVFSLEDRFDLERSS